MTLTAAGGCGKKGGERTRKGKAQKHASMQSVQECEAARDPSTLAMGRRAGQGEWQG